MGGSAFLARTKARGASARVRARVRSGEPSVEDLGGDFARLVPCGGAGRARGGVEGARTLSAGRETTTQALEIDGRGALAPKIEIFYMRF